MPHMFMKKKKKEESLYTYFFTHEKKMARKMTLSDNQMTFLPQNFTSMFLHTFISRVKKSDSNL